MNASGSITPRVGVAPANQRLHPDRAAGLQIERWLVDEEEVAGLHRRGQVHLQPEAVLAADCMPASNKV